MCRYRFCNDDNAYNVSDFRPVGDPWNLSNFTELNGNVSTHDIVDNTRCEYVGFADPTLANGIYDQSTTGNPPTVSTTINNLEIYYYHSSNAGCETDPLFMSTGQGNSLQPTGNLLPINDGCCPTAGLFGCTDNGSTQQIPKDQLCLELRQAGFSPRPRRGQPLSELESALLTIAQRNRIDEVAPVVFSDQRVVEYNSHRILNNANIYPVQPAENGDPANWPFLDKWLSQLFANGKIETKFYFYAWMRRFYMAVLDKKFAQGQALLLVGKTNKGKSLLSNRVISALVGGFADASDYLSGQTNFNKDLARVAAWVIDDTTSAASFQDQRRATELIKRSVANPRIEYHAKYVDAVSVPWTGRVIMSLNMDANSLSVIPALDSSNKDKLMALRISEKATSKFPPNSEVEEIISRELPHFAKWLIDWEVPKEIKGASRFGVASYIDKTIESAAYDNSSRSTVAELVEFFVKRAREYFTNPIWRGTLTEFQGSILEFNGGRNIGVSGSMEFVRRGFLTLEETAKYNKNARPIKSIGFGGGKIWEIDLDEKYDIDKEPVTIKEN